MSKLGTKKWYDRLVEPIGVYLIGILVAYFVHINTIGYALDYINLWPVLVGGLVGFVMLWNGITELYRIRKEKKNRRR